MIEAKKIHSNWSEYLNLIEKHISGPRKNILINFLKEHEDRISMMPASARDWHHSAFPGGYVDHVLRVYRCAVELQSTWEKMGSSNNGYSMEELIFTALFHDLGKMGQQEGEYYQPNDSQWHIDKLGQIYKFNTAIPAMKVPERSLFILQELGVKVTQNEYIAIKIHDGLYDESNKFYFMPGQKETRLRNHLPLLMHQADHMAAQIEFELWVEKNPFTQTTQPSKPKNASKGDKTLRKAKALNIENNPNLSSKTLDVIDSFFKND